MPFGPSLTLYRALANETRLAIIRVLAEEGRLGMKSGQLASRLDISQTGASHHLYILRKAGIVDSCKTNNGKRYFLKDEYKTILEINFIILRTKGDGVY